MTGERAPIRRLLVANRGEIAVRIARTARRLGIETIGVASDADRDAPHTSAVDRVVPIGGERAVDSYLRIDALLDAARAAGADAVHPGYGFLAERADFAEAVLDAGLVWIGPPAAAMRTMGDKAAARRHVAALGIDVLPGYDGGAQDTATLAREAARIGFPLMVKAAAGGGGRGMRLVVDPAALDNALASAAAEAAAAFGDRRLLLERAVSPARHVEVQVFADAHGHVVHLGERDCSLQRRQQKLVEEAPSPAVTPALRRRMGDAAVAITASVGYVGAGTVEFLLETGDAPSFWFMEMNTRLQVEHAVTEALVGCDLVEWQLRVAEGGMLPLDQAEALRRFEAGGHAVEARLCAEDAGDAFLPQSGRVLRWAVPEGVRCDHALAAGTVVSSFYDSMLAKLVAHAPTRPAALAALAAALDRTVCLGVTTNRAFLASLLRDAIVVGGNATTTYVEHRRPAPADDETDHRRGTALAAAAIALLPRDALPAAWRGWSSSPAIDTTVPLIVGSAGTATSWRLVGARNAMSVEPAGPAANEPDRPRHRVDGLREIELDDVTGGGTVPSTVGAIEARVDGRLVRAEWARDGNAWWWLVDGIDLATVDRRLASSRTPAHRGAHDADAMLAPMHGRVTEIRVAAGEPVRAGDVVAVVEAMKMEHQLRSPRAGTVLAVHASVGDQVAARQRLVELAPVPRP